jgi:hypothetical protein
MTDKLMWSWTVFDACQQSKSKVNAAHPGAYERFVALERHLVLEG